MEHWLLAVHARGWIRAISSAAPPGLVSQNSRGRFCFPRSLLGQCVVARQAVDYALADGERVQAVDGGGSLKVRLVQKIETRSVGEKRLVG